MAKRKKKKRLRLDEMSFTINLGIIKITLKFA